MSPPPTAKGYPKMVLTIWTRVSGMTLPASKQHLFNILDNLKEMFPDHYYIHGIFMFSIVKRQKAFMLSKALYRVYYIESKVILDSCPL